MIREKRREDMKKHLGKIIAFVIGISVTGGYIVLSNELKGAK